MNNSIKNIILFLTPFVIAFVLFILGVLSGFELIAVIIMLIPVICVCSVVAEILLDRFGD